MAQSLPVDWNGMPGMLNLHIVPRYDRHRDVGDGHCGEEEKDKEPEVRHEYQMSARNVWVRRLKIL